MKKQFFHAVLTLTLVVSLLASFSSTAFAATNQVVGDGSPASCTEAAFDTALAVVSAAGGLMTFSCGPSPLSIVFTTTKILADGVSIDGGGLITFSGGNAVNLLRVTGAVTLDNLVLRDGNSAAHAGAIEVASSAALTMSNSHLTNNLAAGVGGALLNNGSLSLTNVVLDGNQAAYGGAIYNGGQMTLTDVTLSSNTSTNGGGGIYNVATGNLLNVTISGNSSGDGGGIFNGSNDFLNLSNVTISGNQANFGAGIFNHHGILTLMNVTLAQNQANGGGGILHNNGLAVLNMTNVVLAQNTAVSAGTDQCLFYQTPNILQNSLWSGSSCGTDAVNGNLPQTDALLAPLAFTGTGFLTEKTTTHALLPGSPARDAGVCAEDTPASDQRGVSRPQGAACDMGAVEMQPGPVYMLYLPFIIR